jgi:hypothetical protein
MMNPAFSRRFGQVLRLLEIRERDAGTFTAGAVRST